MGRRPQGHTVILERAYPTPMDEYIMSPELLTIKELVSRWRGRTGCGYSNLTRRAQVENWAEKREKMQAKIRERATEMAAKNYVKVIAERMESDWFDATKRHTTIGKQMQLKGVRVLFEQIDEKDIKASEAIRLLKEGVDIERKALGLADQVIQFQFVQETASIFIDIVERYVGDKPDLIENIARDVLNHVREKATGIESKLEEIQKSGEK